MTEYLQKPSPIPPGSKIGILSRVLYYCKPVLLPILLAVIPTLYSYGNNVEILTLLNLYRMLILNIVVAVGVYLGILLWSRFQPFKAAIGGSIFLIYFNIYGLAYRYLLRADVIHMEHYTFLPLVLMVALYSILFIIKINHAAWLTVWKNLTFVIGVLVLFNLVHIVPQEVKRWESDSRTVSTEVQAAAVLNQDSPDIYYIILDEFAGFQPMREYWHYNEVDDFMNFLKEKGFFVAEQSHGRSTDTLHEVASRLNYRPYGFTVGKQDLFNVIADNKVMRELKSRGYTTVVFDETNMAYFSSKRIRADYLYQYGDQSIPEIPMRASGSYLDDFGLLVMNNTMYYAVPIKYRNKSRMMNWHTSMIQFTVDHVADETVASPKFVYVHLLLPHPPFMFTRDGGVDGSHFTDWAYYLDNYVYSTKVAEEMIGRILAKADPNNPPVIILQSDHGARNTSKDESELLPNYAEEYKTWIMYTLYLPGYDYSTLPQDIDPIDTFPIVLNYLFDAGISVSK